MMKTMKKLLAGAAVAASLFSLAAPASATLTNWYVNTSGGGFAGATHVNDYLDLNGQSYINNTFAGPIAPGQSFTFNEYGNFVTTLADSINPLSPILNSTFIGSGSGIVGGSLNFTPGGTLSVFSGATNIGNFVLTAGSAALYQGSVLVNGFVSLEFDATFLKAGYFFDSAGTDLSTLGTFVMGFATTNAIPGNVSPPVVPTSLITGFNGAFGTSFGTVAYNNTTDLYVANNGQFRLSEVPEPSMLSLFGIALIGLGFMSRRKSKA